MKPDCISRRSSLKTMAGLALGNSIPEARASTAGPRKARICITLDLEMSREFPTRDQMQWDFEKGNLNDQTKQYAVEAARRVKALGHRIHFFALGRTMEQADVNWLEQIIADGHAVGNHTYDHVNLLATRVADLQFRFQRAPWLLEGRSVAQEIERNIQLAERAFASRLQLKRPQGFRTPGGFQNGLHGREDLQKMLLQLGYTYISSVYPAHLNTKPETRPNEKVFQSIVDAQAKAQPFVYPTGLKEIPMSPISDVGALRTGRWPLEDFLEAVRRGILWAIEHQAVYDFLAHPSCLYVTDPELKTLEMILKLAAEHGDRVEIVTLDQVAADLK